MLENPVNFWANRYKKFGHTGWSNLLFYAYDQHERLALISEKISLLNGSFNMALDFGCGTGDFSKMLLEDGVKVWGYDPNVKPDIRHSNFEYIGVHADLVSLNTSMDLILSVTVLDHILDDTELKQELMNFRRIISSRGHLIMLEYAMDRSNNTNNTYQAFRTIADWQKQLAVAGWEIMSIEPASHPVIAPSLGFTHYNSRIPVIFLGKVAKFRPLNAWFLTLLKSYANKSFIKYGLGRVENSALKLICCQPI